MMSFDAFNLNNNFSMTFEAIHSGLTQGLWDFLLVHKMAPDVYAFGIIRLFLHFSYSLAVRLSEAMSC